MSKHTPGPWKVVVSEGRQVEIEAGDGLKIAGLYYTGHPENILTDARLIAAAPEMKDALESIADMQIRPDTNHQELAALCMAIARTALEKAERGKP